jgi:purine-binding chemotaxis protein CheW
MILATSGLAERAAELRGAFDRAFAAPLRAGVAAKADFIAIRAGVERCAIRLAEIAGMFADRKVTRVPAGEAALLGIAGFRGALVPVYCLQTLLGLGAAPSPRWLVIAKAAPVALAFESFEGHLRTSADAILPRQSPDQMSGFAPEFVRADAVVRPVIHLPAVIGALGAAEAAQTTFMQER